MDILELIQYRSASDVCSKSNTWERKKQKSEKCEEKLELNELDSFKQDDYFFQLPAQPTFILAHDQNHLQVKY